MKHRFISKITSLLLIIILVSVPFSGVIASASENEGKELPMIHVPGIMYSDIYVNTEYPEDGLAWPPSADDIIGLVASAIPSLMEFSLTKDWEKLGHAISPLAYELFEPALSDPDGGNSNGSGVIFEYPTEEELEEDPDTTFEYDWRADPIDSAKELNDYVDYILEATGSEKVVLECHSLGGVITLAYCSLYGHDKIEAICFNSTAIFGESYTGDLLSGDMVISNDSLMSYLDFAFDATEKQELLNAVFDLLEEAGLGELVADLGNDILKNIAHILLPEVVIPLFARWLTIWAMVPDDKIDEATQYIFTNYLTEDMKGSSELLEKIENYNRLVRDNKKATLLEIDNDCNLGVIARYGYSSIPATSSWQEISDGVIDTKNASFGATVSYYGSVLDDNIISNTAEEYISPDKTINAATCLFPEKTWFIKSTKHSGQYDDLDNLVKEILYSSEEMTVYSNPDYTRFLRYDFRADRIIPDTEGSAENSQDGFFGFINKIKEFFAQFLKKLRAFFGIIS